MTGSSGVKFAIDATDGASRYLHVRVTISPPFDANKLTLKFPRWVPGSYFIREPMQYLTGISCQQNDQDVSFSRKGVDSVEAKINDHSSDLVVSYKILGIELSVRSTHIDKSHLHMMPPFTFFLLRELTSRVWIWNTKSTYTRLPDGPLRHNCNLLAQAMGVVRLLAT